MAARKLQAEIDRTLKTVSQGVELFEQLYDKLQASTNQTQKEKLESDLKTQIKKLQRLRDQIKGWLGNNDIKDKKPLLDNRKLIETQMERFKATEKEMKTKAFSKEGLIAAAKLDPLEKAKMEMSNWLSNQVDELSRQIETSEAEIEQASSGTGKKSKKGGAGGGSMERVTELETLNERRNWHVGRLEILMRMLENGTLEIEDVETVKDDIAYYVESNAEEDFEEDEGIYDDFNLDEEEEAFGLQQNDDVLSSHDGASVAEDPPKTPVKESAIAKARRDSEDPTKREEMDKSSIPSAKKTARKTTDPTSSTSAPSKPSAEKEKTVPTANFSQAQVKPPVPVTAPVPTSASTTASTTAATAPILSPPKAPGSNQLPPIRYAAAAAAAVSPSGVNAAPPGISPPTQAATAAPATSASNDPSAEKKDEDTTIQQPPIKQQVSPVPSSVPSVPTSEVKSKEEPTTASTIPPPSTVGPPPGIGGLSGPPGLIPRSQSPSQATTSSPSLAYSSAKTGSGSGIQSTSQGSPAVSHASSSAVGLSAAPGSNIEETKETQQQQSLPLAEDSTSSSSSSFQPAQLAASSAAAGVVQPLGGGAGTTSQQLQAQKQSGTESRLPSSLSDLVTSFESVKQKSMLLNNQNNSKSGNGNQIYNNLNTLHESLENSFINVPEPIDSEKPKYYIPKNPFNTPNYYPQNPSGIFENPNVYSKFDVDTLFYIFYYQQGTYHQYLAAKELKKQSWRFHKQYLTWFQRHSEPQAITDEYEQGVYVYFDWENSWCQRKKSDFRFEYRWLEEN